jgi:hypothetical protein
MQYFQKKFEKQSGVDIAGDAAAVAALRPAVERAPRPCSHHHAPRYIFNRESLRK